MADFPYTTKPGSLKRFLDHIQTAGVPDKVTVKYLERVSFKSSNDRFILPVLKFLGFIDSNGVPTLTWRTYRNKAIAKSTLAKSMKEAYGDLFRTYPDAQRKDTEALRNYFSGHTKVAESTLSLIVATFKALAACADFESPAPVTAEVEEKAIAQDVSEAILKKPGAQEGVHGSGRPTINLNIQLQLPATEDASIYDNLFAALKKHLFS